jgi:hypothetical protein
MMEHYKNS